MNKYLNRAEKKHMIRLCAFHQELENTINEYNGHADKEFLKWLRTAATYIDKAIKKRASYLDQDAKDNWADDVYKLQLFFVPSINSVKEYKEHMKLNDAFFLTHDDFFDWWAGNIPFTCGRCLGTKKDKCRQFKFLLKYNVPPIDENPADGICPYSYPAAGLDSTEYFKKQILEAEGKLDAE